MVATSSSSLLISVAKVRSVTASAKGVGHHKKEQWISSSHGSFERRRPMTTCSTFERFIAVTTTHWPGRVVKKSRWANFDRRHARDPARGRRGLRRPRRAAEARHAKEAERVRQAEGARQTCSAPRSGIEQEPSGIDGGPLDVAPESQAGATSPDAAAARGSSINLSGTTFQARSSLVPRLDLLFKAEAFQRSENISEGPEWREKIDTDLLQFDSDEEV